MIDTRPNNEVAAESGPSGDGSRGHTPVSASLVRIGWLVLRWLGSRWVMAGDVVAVASVREVLRELPRSYEVLVRTG